MMKASLLALHSQLKESKEGLNQTIFINLKQKKKIK